MADLSFRTSVPWIVCSCGAEIVPGADLTIEQVWAAHRGKKVKPPTIYRPDQLATDSEVAEYLRRVDNRWYRSILHPDQSRSGHHLDLTDAYEILERLIEARGRCTCGTRQGRLECPND